MRKNRPEYPQNTDYKTNELSFYQYLARINELIKELADRIWDYEKVLAENIEEIERTLKEVVDKIGVGFNEEIEQLLIQWIEDGTLDHIINETLMNKKADKVDLEELDRVLTKEINDFKNKVSNDFETVNETVQQLDRNTQIKLSQINEKIEDKAPYHDIDYTKGYDAYLETTYYLTHVKRGSGANRLNLEYERITSQNKHAVDHARENNTSLSLNAGMFGSSNAETDYPTIENGVISNETERAREYRHYLAIKEDGSLRSYPTSTSPNSMLNDGVKHATVGFAPMYENGQKLTNYMTNYDGFNERHPRQVIAQTDNGDYYILTIGGRGVDGHGATVLEAYDLLMSKVRNVSFAYNLDGGGSSQTVVRGQMINPSYSGRGAVVGAELRKRPDVLYIKGFEKVGLRDENIEGLSKDVALIKEELDFTKGVQYGKWTPALGSVDNYIEESVKYSTQSGDYIRLGNLIIAFYHLVITDKGTGTGIIRMRGLPGANATTDYLTSDVTVMDGFISGSVFNPYFEQRGAGTLQLKALRTDSDDYVGDKRTNEIVLGNYESMKDQFTMIGRHIFIVDGHFKKA